MGQWVPGPSIGVMRAYCTDKLAEGAIEPYRGQLFRGLEEVKESDDKGV